MLGVLKRRWKPKRASGEKEKDNNSLNKKQSKTDSVPADVARINTSQRQIHPVIEEKTQILAYNETNTKKSPPTPVSTPNPCKKTNSETIDTKPPRFYQPPPPPYPPTPNICVEGGRIEFVKSPSEGSNLYANTIHLTPVGKVKQTISAPLTFISTTDLGTIQSSPVTRAQHTQADVSDIEESSDEKCDLAKECLEARIKELERLLEAEQKSGQRERLAVSRLQRQLARRETAQRDVDRERRLRVDTETRLREAAGESERCRASLAGLQREFSRMEDTVRTMLQYKTRCELLNQEKASLTAAYENRAHQYQNTITKLGQENETLRKQLQLIEVTGTTEIQTALFDRLRALENDNISLSREADFQRRQYEKCLDDIANQVVRALLSQKGLREEIGNLQRRIKELENQNHALANILIHKLQNGGNILLDNKQNDDNYSINSPSSASGRSHCPATPESSITSISSVGSPELVKRRLRKHYYSDISDRNLLEALNSLDPMLFLPIQRPKSLNLHLQSSRSTPSSSSVSVVGSRRCTHRRSRSNLANSTNKKQNEDDVPDESPESGNRDEGYSTMSSDVQGPGEASEMSRHELEDVKEATDETDVVVVDNNSGLKSIVLEEPDPDVIIIPINLTLGIHSRHSYPPTRDLSSFTHVIRSFSDSHLCLKLTTPSPVTPVLVFDVYDKKGHPLRRSKATTSLLTNEECINEKEETRSSATSSWCSDMVDNCWWDTEYVQHWLKLDDNRLRKQLANDILELEYDKTELEDWSMSLSCEDITKSDVDKKINEVSTPGTLPSIREIDGVELEEDTNECAWNNASYMKTDIKQDCNTWPYCDKKSSPDCSWSSIGSDDYLNDPSGDSKRSSACSDDVDALQIGTDFTRDFYRLVKYESTKSLASTSNGEVSLNKNVEFKDREIALQSVLNFIQEQQRYCHNREEEDSTQELNEIEENLKESTKDCLVNIDSKENETKEEAIIDKLQRTENFTKCLDNVETELNTLIEEDEEQAEPTREMSESFTSSISTPDTIVPKTKLPETNIPIRNFKFDSPKHKTKIPTPKLRKIETKIPVKQTKPVNKRIPETNIPILRSRKKELSIPVSKYENGMLPDGGFSDRAKSKDVIEELNRMIRKGEEITPGCSDSDVRPLDVACCCPTGWVHVERDIDFTDPKARANLLDVMLASSGSSGGSGSSSDSGGDEPVDYTHLHKLHRFRRQKKASATRDQLGVLRCPLSSVRPSIIGRDDFFVRYGEKEREAVSSFDFLEDLSTTSISGCSSCDTIGSNQQKMLHRELDIPSPDIEIRTPVTPITPDDDSDDRTGGGQVSFSDSCADSFSASSASFEENEQP